MKILLSLVIALVIVFVLNATIFFNGIPKINKEKIKRTGKDIRDELIIFKNTFTYKLSNKKVDYSNTFSDAPTIEFILAPTIAIPSPTPTFIPTPTPTLVPTSTPYPTKYLIQPTYTAKPTTIPTLRPTKIPIPSPIPTEAPDDSSLLVKNPLDQPYYNPRLAYQCYNPENFIKVYAGGVNPGSCYGNVQDQIEKNLTSVSVLGKSITVHKKAYPAFKSVSDKLKNFKGYKINTIGAYIFRCNVNASTSGKNDLCSSGCVLSPHSFGIDVDINWDENCNGCSSFTMPREIIDAFESYGFRWGGRYKSVFGSTIDPMHFEYMYDLCKDIN